MNTDNYKIENYLEEMLRHYDKFSLDTLPMGTWNDVRALYGNKIIEIFVSQ